MTGAGSDVRDAPAGRPAPPGREADAAAVLQCLQALFQSVREYSKAIQRQVRLSGPQVWALSLLEREPRLSLGGLSRRMYAHPSTVSGIVERLVERGAVLREVDRSDRRGVRLSLTPRGRQLARESPPPVQLGISRALASMSLRRLRDLRRSLEDVARRARVGGPARPARQRLWRAGSRGR